MTATANNHNDPLRRIEPEDDEFSQQAYDDGETITNAVAMMVTSAFGRNAGFSLLIASEIPNGDTGTRLQCMTNMHRSCAAYAMGRIVEDWRERYGEHKCGDDHAQQ